MDNNNNLVNDRYRIDLNRDGTLETYTHDTAIHYNVTITYTYGAQPATLAARLVQTTSGDLFLVPSIPNADIAVLQAAPIAAITINSINNATTVVLLQDRPTNTFLVCFAAGMHIRTPLGDICMEDLAPGMQVCTADHRDQTIRWAGSARVDLTKKPNLRPIRLRAGSLGGGKPEQDLIVSPQQRILVRSKIAQRLFSTDEVLVAAQHLISIESIDVIEDLAEVRYVHFLCDDHQIVFANRAETENLFTGAQALKSVSPAALEEFLTIFPELRDREFEDQTYSARPLLNGSQGRTLAERHLLNNKPLVS